MVRVICGYRLILHLRLHRRGQLADKEKQTAGMNESMLVLG